MNWMRYLVANGWLILFSLLLAEQSINPFIQPDAAKMVSEEEPISQYNQADDPMGFLLYPTNGPQTAPVPAIRVPLFKWRAHLSERTPDPSFTHLKYPEFTQDTQRCPTVAIVLFPYHEFL